MREDLSSGFTTMQDSNQPAQLQRVHVARKLNFACSKFFNYTFKGANNKGTDQTARMCRLVCAFNLRMQLQCTSGFLSTRPISMITVIIIIALFFNVFTPRLGRSMDDTLNERY